MKSFQNSDEIRQDFLDFFHSNGHTIIESSKVVPLNDPTLLFSNAGMNQFKPIFLGTVEPSSDMAKLKRACDTQKCIRAGGKHNDLEDVGKDVYHHTFFEMLGNWSFGDYFKADAISFAWRLLTEKWGLDKDRLYVSYFDPTAESADSPADSPAESANSPGADFETRDIWLKYLPASHVIGFGMKENFWEMGEVGPCGPCTEIHYDRVGGRDAAALVNADDPDVMEIWNLVFMQFNREESGNLTPLPNHNVDTGMGFERISSILMNHMSNYDCDIFRPLIDAMEEICQATNSPTTGPRKYLGLVGAEDSERIDMAYRVIADHARTACVAIADGSPPSNEGRGYVIRRVIRRAVRYGRQILQAGKEPWFYKLVDVVAANLGKTFVSIQEQKERLKEIIKEEEISFGRTIDRGTQLFNKQVALLEKQASASAGAGAIIEGKFAFELYSTYGFPLDLIQILADERSLTVDIDGFNDAFSKHQKSSSENNELGVAHKLLLKPNDISYLNKNVEITDDSLKYDWDTLGDGPEIASKIVAIFHNGEFVQSVNLQDDSGDSGDNVNFAVILNKTPFYAESGGQVGDIGQIQMSVQNEYLNLNVVDTKKFGHYAVHMVSIASSDAKVCVCVGDAVLCRVDYGRRSMIAKNHTGTHILNYALRKILGPHVEQKGSVVEPNRLRFDFDNPKSLTADEISQIENEVKQIIQSKATVHRELVPLGVAKNIPGLRSVFGESYPDPVIVVSAGVSVKDLLSTGESVPLGTVPVGTVPVGTVPFGTSIEFCGGTHLANVSEIMDFCIISEEAIAKGIRRIVAATGESARDAIVCGKTIETQVEETMQCSNLSARDKLCAKLKFDLTAQKEALPLSSRKKAQDCLDTVGRQKVEAGKIKTKQQMQLAAAMGDSKGEELATAKFVVLELPELEGDAKCLDQFNSSFTKKSGGCPVAVLSAAAAAGTAAGSADPEVGVCMVFANASSVDCSLWIQGVMSGVDGCKGGGKKKSAQASCPKTGLGAAKSNAENWLHKNL